MSKQRTKKATVGERIEINVLKEKLPGMCTDIHAFRSGAVFEHPRKRAAAFDRAYRNGIARAVRKERERCISIVYQCGEGGVSKVAEHIRGTPR